MTVRFIYHREMLNRRLRDVLVICLCVGGPVCGQHSERGPDGDWTQPVQPPPEPPGPDLALRPGRVRTSHR